MGTGRELRWNVRGTKRSERSADAASLFQGDGCAAVVHCCERSKPFAMVLWLDGFGAHAFAVFEKLDAPLNSVKDAPNHVASRGFARRGALFRWIEDGRILVRLVVVRTVDVAVVLPVLDGVERSVEVAVEDCVVVGLVVPELLAVLVTEAVAVVDCDVVADVVTVTLAVVVAVVVTVVLAVVVPVVEIVVLAVVVPVVEIVALADVVAVDDSVVVAVAVTVLDADEVAVVVAVVKQSNRGMWDMIESRASSFIYALSAPVALHCRRNMSVLYWIPFKLESTLCCPSNALSAPLKL